MSNEHTVKKVSEFSETTDPQADDLLFISEKQDPSGYISKYARAQTFFRKVDIVLNTNLNLLVITK